MILLPQSLSGSASPRADGTEKIDALGLICYDQTAHRFRQRRVMAVFLLKKVPRSAAMAVSFITPQCTGGAKGSIRLMSCGRSELTILQTSSRSTPS